MLRSSLLNAVCLSLALSSPLLAQEVPEDTGLLTLEAPNEAAPVELDLAALKAMPVTEIETSTVWTDGVTRFTGVALSDLLADLGEEGTVIHAMARDGYTVEIPVTDAVPHGPIVAYEMDGAPIEADMMGPYWIIYPYDSDEAYRTEEIEARSIWQLARLTLAD
ncbi:molybdopterin-dependent oxidoreductase [Limimaricola litoreus]|uniref:Molybdopterin-dependent oxidoreductase n=1 Tax=Limimaricola litoreus TaxID=2955316 RepID=A0A9X2FQG0_9RHOB|nr:molybdopterin-dependent oxidoreductase [Limimaricola litoreus]MCP1167949.1 molybdopterin-dependent oxidoreductase [Limimaricola litoreus]